MISDIIPFLNQLGRFNPLFFAAGLPDFGGFKSPDKDINNQQLALLNLAGGLGKFDTLMGDIGKLELPNPDDIDKNFELLRGLNDLRTTNVQKTLDYLLGGEYSPLQRNGGIVDDQRMLNRNIEKEIDENSHITE